MLKEALAAWSLYTAPTGRRASRGHIVRLSEEEVFDVMRRGNRPSNALEHPPYGSDHIAGYHTYHHNR